jgi:hypothetical protein
MALSSFYLEGIWKKLHDRRRTHLAAGDYGARLLAWLVCGAFALGWQLAPALFFAMGDLFCAALVLALVFALESK